MPGNIGWQGVVIILLVLLVIFGPKRLPELGRSLGRGMREFKDSVAGDHHAKDDEVAETRAEPAQIAQASAPEAEAPPQPRERDSVV